MGTAKCEQVASGPQQAATEREESVDGKRRTGQERIHGAIGRVPLIRANALHVDGGPRQLSRDGAKKGSASVPRLDQRHPARSQDDREGYPGKPGPRTHIHELESGAQLRERANRRQGVEDMAFHDQLQIGRGEEIHSRCPLAEQGEIQLQAGKVVGGQRNAERGGSFQE
jgi:hypothetical protein